MATMPNDPEFPPRTRRQQTRSRTVLFVAFEGMGLLDLSGSTTVFWSASSFMKQQGKLGYSLYAVSIDGGPIITEEGIGIVTVPVSDFARAAIDTVTLHSIRGLAILIFQHCPLFYCKVIALK